MRLLRSLSGAGVSCVFDIFADRGRIVADGASIFGFLALELVTWLFWLGGSFLLNNRKVSLTSRRFVAYLSAACFAFSELSDLTRGILVELVVSFCVVRRSRGETGFAFSALALSCRIFAERFRAASVMRTSGATFFILKEMLKI